VELIVGCLYKKLG